MLLKISRAGRVKGNICRNLHRLIAKSNKSFPVEIGAVWVEISIRKPVLRQEMVMWPFLTMTSWLKALLCEAPEVILAGCKVKEVAKWRQTFASFWDTYEGFNGQHELFTTTFDKSCCVPYFLHGDEGTGHCRRPFFVESWQPVLSWKGGGVTNESGFLGCFMVRFSIDR